MVKRAGELIYALSYSSWFCFPNALKILSFVVCFPTRLVQSTWFCFAPKKIVSLQNCAVKIAFKCLSNRAQPFISQLIHHDKTGFIGGTGITKNFTYAADMVQSCFKRQKPVIVVRLDFQKAFGSVSWSALSTIMRVKGFRHLSVVGFKILTCRVIQRCC